MTIPPSVLTPAPAVKSDRSRLMLIAGSPRTAFVLRRLGRAAVSFVIVLVASFFMVQLVPGDPVRAALGPTAPVATVEALRTRLGLDLPPGEQFTNYLGGLLHGDLGVSVTSQRPVADMLGDRKSVV